MEVCKVSDINGMTDTMGRMHSDAQFAGSSSGKMGGEKEGREVRNFRDIFMTDQSFSLKPKVCPCG